MRSVSFLTLLVGLTLLAPGAARAQTHYKIQPIVKLGDQVGDVTIKVTGGDFEVGTLNDAGQISFVTENAAGGEMLIQYADGKLAPIVVPGKDAPGGTWGAKNGVNGPASMNQLGNLVLATDVTVANETSLGTFLWDYKAQKVTAVVLKGMPAVNSLTFEQGGGKTPVINNSNEIALVAQVKNAAGEAQNGVFFRGRDGKLLPVALPDQELPGGGKVLGAVWPAINDAGVVAFLATRPGDAAQQFSGYVWEQGTITPLAVVGTDAPGGGKFAHITTLRVNSKHKTMLVEARVGDLKGADGLYLFANGKLTAVAVPGQEMPGGGKLKTVQHRCHEISYTIDSEQYAFLGDLDDGATAAYLMDADGKLSLIVKSGMTTDLGKITDVGHAGTQPPSFGVGLNNKGQVALPVQIDGGTAMIVLLTPVAQ